MKENSIVIILLAFLLASCGNVSQNEPDGDNISEITPPNAIRKVRAF